MCTFNIIYGSMVMLLAFGSFALADNKLHKLLLTKFEKEVNPEYCNLEIQIRNSTDHHIYLDVDVDVIQDIDETLAVVLAAYLKDPSGNFNQLLITQPQYLCALFKDPTLDPVFITAFDGLKNHGNIVNACPYKKGHYRLENYKIDSANLPEITPLGDYRIDMDYTVKKDGKDVSVVKIVWFNTIEKI